MDRSVIASGTNAGTVVDARMSLALWLRAGRAQRGMTLEDVAKVTKIQPRILERLEAGKLDGLPADVFVRGFVRSVAKCVGLDEDEALRRYRDAASQQANGPAAATPAARALVETMSDLAPTTARSVAPRVLVTAPDPAIAATAVQIPAPAIVTDSAPIVEAISEAAATPKADVPAEVPDEVSAATLEIPTEAAAETAGKKKRGRRGGKGRNKRKALATGTPAEPTPVIAATPEPSDIAMADALLAQDAVATTIEVATAPTELASAADPTATADNATTTPEIVAPTETWTPKMPTIVAPSVPWRRPSHAVAPASMARIVPSLVIDDADPDIAEREQEDRVTAREPARRTFLPPILLDREDRSARQGGLTLAVIILLIAATLTLSYLMRRPSSSGDGVTMLDGTQQPLA